jgi:hypothetical protein
VRRNPGQRSTELPDGGSYCIDNDYVFHIAWTSVEGNETTVPCGGALL